MKLKTLLEVPVKDFKRVGDFDKAHGFRDPRDRKMIQSDKYKDIVYKKFKNLEHDVNFFFVNTPKANRYTEEGAVDHNWVKTNLGDDIAGALSDSYDEDAIHVIFTNNKGDARVPMTPWIIAHRIGHALARPQSGFQRGRQFTGYDQLVDMVDEMTYYILDEVYGFTKKPKTHSFGDRGQRQNQLMFRSFWHAIGTFKSARDRNLRDYFEVYNELIAQYMITGKIKLNELPKSFKHGRHGQVSVIDKEAYEELKDLDRYAYSIELHCDWLLSEALGRILVM